MLVVYNPSAGERSATLTPSLYYTGLTDVVRVTSAGGATRELRLSRDYRVELPVQVPARGMSWYLFE